MVAVIKRRLEVIRNKSFNSTDRENNDIFHYAVKIIFEIKEISLKEESIFGSPNEVRRNFYFKNVLEDYWRMLSGFFNIWKEMYPMRIENQVF